MTSHNLEFLVTAQAYKKNDPDKQTILLHDTFFEKYEYNARQEFYNRFDKEYNIIKIFSVIDVSTRSV